MRLDRVTRRLSAWFAAGAILFSALAPALAQAWADPETAALAVVCSAPGASRAGQDAPPKAPAAAQLFEHCPCCSLHASMVALPPAERRPLVLADLAMQAPAPAPRPRAPGGTEVWPGARPRAPPLPG